MMISRSGDILEISTSMYLYIFLLKYARSAKEVVQIEFYIHYIYIEIYIHYITTVFVLESFILSCWLLKAKKIGIGHEKS